MKTKNIKVAYTSRYQKQTFSSVPKIQFEGKWLEELGFSIGSTVRLEYEEGSIRIRPLTEEELNAQKQEALRADFARRTAELQAMKKSLLDGCRELSMVAEPQAGYASPTARKSRRKK